MLFPAQLTRLAKLLRGLPIVDCQPGSAADRAGIRYGDIVLSMNSSPTPSWLAFFQTRSRIRGSVWVRVFRRGKELVLPLELPPESREPHELVGAPHAGYALSGANALAVSTSADSYS